MDQARLKINDEEVGLRLVGDGLYEPNNLSIFEKVFHNEYVPNDEEFFTIRRFPKEEPKKYHKIESFCFVATENIKEEAELLLKSLREFHSQPVYVICDKETRMYLVRQKLSKNVTFRTCAEQEHLDKINEKIFKNHSCIANNIHNPSAIFKKMDVMDFALEHHSNTFFLDADIIVLDSLQEYFTSLVALSPHYYPKGRGHKGFEFGFYNAGYVFCASKGFPRFWKHMYLNDSTFFEQECMNRIPQYYNIQTFSEEHNIGFWRGDRLSKKAKSIHAHITSGVDANRSEQIINLNTKIKDYAIEQTKKYQPKIASHIRKHYNPVAVKKIAHIHFGKCAGAYVKSYLARNFLHPLNYAVFDSWHIVKQPPNSQWAFDFEDSKVLDRDWTEDELIEIIDKGKEKVYVHNHHFTWSKKTVKYANEKGLLTFCFLRCPKDLLCSLYWWAKDRIEEGKVNILFDPSAKKAFDLVGTHPNLEDAEGFDSVFGASCLNLTLDDFIRIFSHEENKNGCGKLWNIPDWMDDVQYVAEFSDENFSYFLKKYFDHEYVPTKKLNTSQNKGYEFYYNNGEISEESHQALTTHPEYKKYSKYINI
jgi:hypothetical protein